MKEIWEKITFFVTTYLVLRRRKVDDGVNDIEGY